MWNPPAIPYVQCNSYNETPLLVITHADIHREDILKTLNTRISWLVDKYGQENVDDSAGEFLMLVLELDHACASDSNTSRSFYYFRGGKPGTYWWVHDLVRNHRKISVKDKSREGWLAPLSFLHINVCAIFDRLHTQSGVIALCFPLF